MKSRTLVTITASIITASAIILTAGLALLNGSAIDESSIPTESALPALGGLSGDIEAPESQQQLIGKISEYVTVTEENGITKTVIFTEEQLKAIAERRKNGEWLSLSLNEMYMIINETVDIFYASDIIEVGLPNGGVYSTKTYNGYKYYVSDEYKKTETEVNAKHIIYDIIFARIATLNDALVGSSDLSSTVYALADAPRMSSDELLSNRVSIKHYWTAEASELKYAGLQFYQNDKIIKLVAETETAMAYQQGDYTNGQGGCSSVQVFPTKTVQEELIDRKENIGSRVVKVKIYKDGTDEFVTEFDITDTATVNAIFDGFHKSFDLACQPSTKYPSIDPECEYRVVITCESRHENLTNSNVRSINIGYAYGYDNDSYCYYHFIPGVYMDEISKDLSIQKGADFINLVDPYVDEYFGK